MLDIIFLIHTYRLLYFKCYEETGIDLEKEAENRKGMEKEIPQRYDGVDYFKNNSHSFMK